MKNQIDNQLERVCLEGVCQGVFSAAAAAVCFTAEKERKWSIFTCGATGYSPGYSPVTAQTIFDLASLTKPLSTALCIVHLIVDNLLTIETTLADIYPDLPVSHATITIGQLLAHCSGLPSYRTYFTGYKPVSSPTHTEILVDSILAEYLENEPGKQILYSDLGYILLGDIIERISGKRQAVYFSEKIASPLGLSDDLFFLHSSCRRSRCDFAATELCGWRKRVIQGEVHDENCWFIGGTAGHAGLFGTIKGVTVLVEKMLASWVGDVHSQALGGEVFTILLQFMYKGSERYIGFDRPTPGASSSGTYFSADSAGHLGFTGTSFWMDPLKNVAVILLTNRVHLSRSNERIKAFRPYFHDMVMEAVQKAHK
ncbi:serine hydrolase domain-containing protein [Desulfogranum japonicum]|uniref:serine hydrolase domain-containing protein n=1 Tax=Desulfogranum japonicum TaxID=231447 RepID=UPI0006862307|nr:serine hydrolase [Desulfogranum japonicum]